jgi:hypothetical protein
MQLEQLRRCEFIAQLGHAMIGSPQLWSSTSK